MADLVLSPSLVVADPTATITREGVAAVDITPGKLVYRDPDTKKFKLSDSNSPIAAARSVYGIALNFASLNQPLAVGRLGPISFGAVLTPGATYFLSDTPGGICEAEDLGSDEYVALIGLARSETVLNVAILNTLVLKAGGAPPALVGGAFQFNNPANSAFLGA